MKTRNDSDVICELTPDREFSKWLDGEAREDFMLALHLIHDGDFVIGRLRLMMQQAYRAGFLRAGENAAPTLSPLPSQGAAELSGPSEPSLAQEVPGAHLQEENT